MTHKSVAEKAKKKFPVKENDPRYKHYTKAQAVEANRKLREDRLKVERYAESLKQEKQEEVRQDTPVVPDNVNADKIAKLERQLANEGGPGSNHRKAKIQAEIDKLKG
jgi:hypothetical protein